MSLPRYSLNLRFDKMPYLDPLFTFTRASTATRVNPSTGLIESVAANTPRLEADGLLIEEARTNLATYSGDNSVWGKNLASIGAATTAPDGTESACQLVSTTDSGQHRTILPQPSLADSTTYCFSAFLKEAGYPYLYVGGVMKDGVFYNPLKVNLGTGAVEGGTVDGSRVLAAGVEDYGDGWYRLWVVANTLTGSSTPYLAFYMASGTGYNVNFAGDGTSGFYVWGGQVEAGLFPTSYIPTTTAAVTRAAELCYADVTDLWPESKEFTLVAEVDPLNCVALTGIGARYVVVARDDGSADDEWGFLQDSTSGKLYASGLTAGVSTLTATAITGARGTKIKLGLSAATSQARVYADGALQLTDTAITLPSPEYLRIGSSVNAGTSKTGLRIRSCMLLPYAVDTYTLKALTT